MSARFYLFMLLSTSALYFVSGFWRATGWPRWVLLVVIIGVDIAAVVTYRRSKRPESDPG